MISLLKYYERPWEDARGILLLDMEHIEAAINQRWAATFGDANSLSLATVVGALGTVLIGTGPASSFSANPVVTSITLGSTVASSTTGAVRLAYAGYVKGRNKAGTADRNIIGLDTVSIGNDNTIGLGDSGAPAVVPGSGDSAGTIGIDAGQDGTSGARWLDGFFARHILIGGAGWNAGTVVNWALATESFTKATAGTPIQYSPAHEYRANGWNTTSVVSDSHFFLLHARASTGATTGGQFVFRWLRRDASGGGAGPTVDLVTINSDPTETSVQMGVGTMSPQGTFDISGGVNADMYKHSYADVSRIFLRRADTSASAPSAVQLDETIGSINGWGFGATVWGSTPSAAIRFLAAQNYTDTAKGGYINFVTAANGTATLVNRMRIDQSGFVGIGGITPTAELQVGGNLSSAAWTTGGIAIATMSASYTDTTSVGAVAEMGVNCFNTPTILASSVTTYADAATLYIGAAPIASTNVTITRPYALLVRSGQSGFNHASSHQINAFGWDSVGGGTTNNGSIAFGLNTSFQGVVHYDAGGNTIFYVDNRYDNASAAINFRLRTGGTPVVALALIGSGQVELAASKAIFDSGGKVTKYNNISTTGWGVPALHDTKALTNQSADITTTNLTNAGVVGTYRVSYSLLDTTADLAAGTVTLTIAFTDDAGATTITATQVLTGVGRASGVNYIQLASGNITYAVSHTGIFGTAKYALYLSLERLS